MKHNWPNLHAEIARAFDDPQTAGLLTQATVEGDHGHIEQRHHAVSIENRLHWVLDVVFHEDLSRLRSGHGPQNMATVRHVALNLLRGAKDKHSLKVRRKSAAWNDACLQAIVRQTA